MSTHIDHYREGYEQGQHDNLAGNIAETIFIHLRNDPEGWFAAGYRDGAAGRKFTPPAVIQNGHYKEISLSRMPRQILVGVVRCAFLPFYLLPGLFRDEKNHFQIGWRIAALLAWSGIVFLGFYELSQVSGRVANNTDTYDIELITHNNIDSVRITRNGTSTFISSSDIARYATIEFNRPHDILTINCPAGYVLSHEGGSTGVQFVRDPILGLRAVIIPEQQNKLNFICTFRRGNG